MLHNLTFILKEHFYMEKTNLITSRCFIVYSGKSATFFQ